MIADNNIWNLAEAYATGTLPDAERAALEERLATNPVFATDFQEAVNLVRSLQNSGGQKRFRNMLQDINKQQKAENTPVAKHVGRTIPLRTHYLRTAAVAAGIALLTSLTTFWIGQNNNRKIASQYSLLRRDLETYKRSHNQLVTNIKTPQPEPANYTGTGFAITNDGYLVTNYHVTEGADSLYIQNRAGQYYKAQVVSFDEKADVAILKVQDKSFRFSKSEVPYSFAGAKSKLGERIFSLGFPQDEIVYNEGYVSSKNGFGGDSMQYRLEIPSAPGQSGAPVLDDNGNVVAIITGKESASEGITYAISSKAVIQLVRALPKDIRLPKSNKLGKLSREQQIDKLENYTCAVKVYKN